MTETPTQERTCPMKRRYSIAARERLAQPAPSSFFSVATERDLQEAGQPRPARVFVDFSIIPPHQAAMHERLENWARASRGGDKQSGTSSPMFRLHQSDAWTPRAYGAETTAPVNRQDAMLVNKGVVALPEKHRRAVQWYYLHPGKPAHMARELGQTLQGLADLVRDGRQFLINRGV